ncbi:hypothetical protein AB1Y20_021346 [Prymnesium parvum]|uniref:Secreted protein n=1 Tax=Prymnesium parvum TaxID=97485 RepID=A0AB34JIF4_PRYPA
MAGSAVAATKCGLLIGASTDSVVSVTKSAAASASATCARLVAPQADGEDAEHRAEGEGARRLPEADGLAGGRALPEVDSAAAPTQIWSNH